MQFSVFLFRLLEDRDVGIGVFPQGEEVLIGRSGFDGFPLHGIGSTDLEMRQRTDGLVHNDTAMVEDFLELGGGFPALARRQVSLAADINGIQGGPTVSTRCRLSQFVRRSGAETLNGLGSVTSSDRSLCPKGRQIIELHHRIFGKPFIQIVAECLRAHGYPNFPDPKELGQQTLPAGIDVNSAQFQTVETTCEQHARKALGLP